MPHMGAFATTLAITLVSDGRGTKQHAGHYIFCSLASFSVKLYPPFVPSFSLSLCFSADYTDSLQAEEKPPPSTAVEFLSVGNRGPSSQDSVTNSYHHQKSTKH